MTSITSDEAEYFARYEALFNSDGWQLFLKDLDEENRGFVEATFWNAKDMNQVSAFRGRLTLVREILNWHNIVNAKLEMTRQRPEPSEFPDSDDSSLA